jgi:raffinose/stachyose/melibiose transport system substrate-binding protein
MHKRPWKRRKSMKYQKSIFLLVAVLVITGATLFAAGATESAKQDSVTVEIYHHKIPWIDAWEEMSEEYEQSHPTVNLETEVVGGASDWRTLLKTKFAANKAPDIFIIEGFSDYQLWKEYIETLDKEPWVDHLLPISKDAATQDDHIIALPVTIEGYGYIYNKNLFKKAGITELPTTFSEMKKTVATLKQNGITPFASGFGTWWVISNHFTNIPFAQQENPRGYISDLNNGKAKIPGNKEFLDWKQAFDLVLQNCEPNPLTTDHNMQVTMFANQEVAMIQQGNWKQSVIFETDPDLDIGLLPIFTSDDEEKANRIPVGIPFMFVVNSQSPETEKQAAKDFLTWLVSSDEGKQYLAEEFDVIPALDNIEASPSLGGVSKDIVAFAQDGKTIPWMFSYWPDGAVNEFSDLAQRYVAGLDSFTTYLENLQNSWDRLQK